jgi:hypothetical protein
MRIFEFAGDDNLDKFLVVIKNFVGRNASKKSPARLNWQALDRIMKTSGIELMADYETFKSMYDSSPQLQMLVKNFNANGIELNVPGASDAAETPDGTAQPQDSQAAVDKMAASAAPQQLAAQA